MIDQDSVRTPTPAIDRALKLLAVVAVAMGVVLRLWPRRSLWLDEALSVNIASLPVTEIPAALKRDGHPPLYYFLLHYWLNLGDSDWTARLFSAVVGIATFPFVYLAGYRIGARTNSEGLGRRRTGLIAVALFALMPYGIRYSSEARMYALMSLLMLVGYLLLDNLLSPSRVRDSMLWPAIGLTVVTTAMLYTHYWAIWLGAAVALLVAFVAWQAMDPRNRKRALAALGALALGALLYLPWVPTLLYQSEHTGTPWGEVYRPATILVTTIFDYVGGGFGEVQVITYLLVSAIGVAVIGILRPRAGMHVVELTARVQSRILPELYVFLATMVIAWAASVAASATYASRYSAAIYPLFALMVAAGFAMARSTRVTAVLVAVTLVAFAAGATWEVTRDRTQAGPVAESIAASLEAAAVQDPSSPVTVIVCPDQLGPATGRALENLGVEAEVIPYPSGVDPEFVDWVDYAERNAAADPTAFAKVVAAEVDPAEPVYFVMNPSYLTFEGRCEHLLAALNAEGLNFQQVIAGDPDYFEFMDLWSTQPAP